MREILFRGKRIDDGEWVEGYYVKALDMYEKEIHVIFDTTATFYSCGETSGFELVAPETICQYTGLTDRNGKKIWEGDILQEKYYPYRTYKVVWSEEAGGWTVEFRSVPLYSIGGANSKIYELIGNAFDNTELLEE